MLTGLAEDEWVLVVSGLVALEIEGRSDLVRMGPGDYLYLPGRHWSAVARTLRIWLEAVRYYLPVGHHRGHRPGRRATPLVELQIVQGALITVGSHRRPRALPSAADRRWRRSSVSAAARTYWRVCLSGHGQRQRKEIPWSTDSSRKRLLPNAGKMLRFARRLAEA